MKKIEIPRPSKSCRFGYGDKNGIWLELGQVAEKVNEIIDYINKIESSKEEPIKEVEDKEREELISEIMPMLNNICSMRGLGFSDVEDELLDFIEQEISKARQEGQKDILCKIRMLNGQWVKDFKNKIYTKEDVIYHIDSTLQSMLEDLSLPPKKK